ncbi:MAG: hypothetical protein PHW79_06255 [Candidatus Marinimicrobia bacterium]|nr:hypothetical protein [Candidatus Neomarinimicrobiota bacterium]
MKCDDFKTMMIDAIYNEIADEDRKHLSVHIVECEKCRAEFSGLRTTSQTMKKWEDVEPDMHLTFVKESRSFIGDWIGNLKPGKVVSGLGIAFASLLLILSIANFRMTVQDGKYDFRMSLLGKSVEPAPVPVPALTPTVTQADLEKLKSENLKAFVQILDEYAKKDKIETVTLVSELYKEVERNRQADLKLVSTAVEGVHYGAQRRSDETDRAIGNLIRYVNLQSGAPQQ